MRLGEVQPFALLWFRDGREEPLGVQPELAQQA